MAQTKEEKRKRHREYMREYYHKNKDRINARNKELYEQRIENDPEEYKKIRERHNKACARYREKNKDEINDRAKERNWNYNPETAKIKRKRHYQKHPIRNVLRARKSYAKKNDLAFEITEEWYASEFERGCSVTKIPFDDNRSDTPWVAHIDRIDPKQGYTEENCRLVCACYNIAKKHWTDADVMKMAKALLLENQ